MVPRFSRRALAIALLLAACDSSTEPEPLTGVYVAQSADGRAMPALVDSLPWTDGRGYTLYRLTHASVEFLDHEYAYWTYGERQVSPVRGDSAISARCRSVTVPYRRENGRVLLIIEPALFGETGRLRMDTLEIQNDKLVQTVRVESGKPVRVEYARDEVSGGC
jgi:hypothetical protein